MVFTQKIDFTGPVRFVNINVPDLADHRRHRSSDSLASSVRPSVRTETARPRRAQFCAWHVRGEPRGRIDPVWNICSQDFDECTTVVDGPVSLVEQAGARRRSILTGSRQTRASAIPPP